jgi:hypothetical protein
VNCPGDVDTAERDVLIASLQDIQTLEEGQCNDANRRWITISSIDDQGVRTSLACLANPDTFAADTVAVDPVEFDRLRARLQCEPMYS